jgi:hypothetical protein
MKYRCIVNLELKLNNQIIEDLTMHDYKTDRPYLPDMRSASESYHARKGIDKHGPIKYKAMLAKAALNQGAAVDEHEAVKIADQEYDHACRIQAGFRLNEESHKELNTKETKGTSGYEPLLA